MSNRPDKIVVLHDVHEESRVETEVDEEDFIFPRKHS